jgi:2-C-methyl-D-erythritol 4-phosphate cytidylyltransferase
MKTGAVIVAAGQGSRMRTAVSKQYLPLAGKPILVHTLLKFQAHPDIGVITVVVPPGDERQVREMADQFGCGKVRHIVAGGSERQHSVARGLATLRGEADLVLVHDAVRPFVTDAMITAACAAAATDGAAVLAVPVKDTIKVARADGTVESTPDRRSLWAVQTPQAFRLSLLLDAYEQAERDGFIGTDDAMLVERLGHPVRIVHGDYANIKITTPEDLDWAEHSLKNRDRGERS